MRNVVGKARRLLPNCRNQDHGLLRKRVRHAEGRSTLAQVPKEVFHRLEARAVMVAASVTVSFVSRQGMRSVERQWAAETCGQQQLA